MGVIFHEIPIAGRNLICCGTISGETVNSPATRPCLTPICSAFSRRGDSV